MPNGVLLIDPNTQTSRLQISPNNKPRLAKDDDGDPFLRATDFLINERNLNDLDFISVVGSPSGGILKFTDAHRVAIGMAALKRSSKKSPKKAGKKTGKKATKTNSKKSAKKQGVKKTK